MEEKLFEILNKNLDELNEKKEGLKTIISNAKDGKGDIQDTTIEMLLKDKRQVEEELKNEKEEYIIKEYNNDLNKITAEIENWEQNKLNELKNIEDEIKSKNAEMETLEKYKEEKANYEESNKRNNEYRENLEKNKEQAEIELNKLTNNGEKTFFGEKPIELRECEAEIQDISERISKLDVEEEKENKNFKKIEGKFTNLCEKYNVEELLKSGQANKKTEIEVYDLDLNGTELEDDEFTELENKLNAIEKENKVQEVEEDFTDLEFPIVPTSYTRDTNQEVEKDKSENVTPSSMYREENEELDQEQELDEMEAIIDEEEQEVESKSKKTGKLKEWFEKIKQFIKNTVNKIKNGVKKLTERKQEVIGDGSEEIDTLDDANSNFDSIKVSQEVQEKLEQVSSKHREIKHFKGTDIDAQEINDEEIEQEQ